MDEFWKVAVTLCGIGAVGSFVVFSLYKQWLQLGVFANLTRQQTFLLLRRFLTFTFVFGVIALASFTFIKLRSHPERIPDLKYPKDAELVQLNVAFESTGERKALELPLDLNSKTAAKHVAEYVYFGDSPRSQAYAARNDFYFATQGGRVPGNKTLREAGLKDGDHVTVEIEIQTNDQVFTIGP